MNKADVQHNDTRPPIEQVVDAVQRRARREARAALRAWWLPLSVRYILDTPVWVIGGSHVWEFQKPLWQQLEPLALAPTTPRLIIGNGQFWAAWATALWEAEQYDELERRLPSVLATYHPATYLVWGRLLARRQRLVTAGMYLLLSGNSAPKEAPLIAQFKHWCLSMSPQQVVSQLPEPCRRRWARAIFPERVFADFADIPCPDWWRKRPRHGM